MAEVGGSHEVMNILRTASLPVHVSIGLGVALVLGGCTSAATIEVEMDPAGAEESVTLEAPAQVIADELPEEIYDGDYTLSGFPVGEIDAVKSKFGELASSVVRPFGGYSSGTGWVYDSTHVVTNWHVVDGIGGQVSLETLDGDELRGTVIATEEFDDIAVIELSQPTTLKPLLMSSSPAVEDDAVFFIGHPSSIGEWITGVGTVSAVDAYSGFVYTSLPASPGASGSPMFNLSGEVVALISGCMDSVERSYRGDGSRVFSYAPPKPNCGGTQVARVVEFVDNAISSR